MIEKIHDIPEKPGIYKMKDKYGNIIYIGKSKSLRSRVRSYFNDNHKQEKIKRMVFYIEDIDIILTDTHLEAQILECSLIKNIKPLYNKQMKSDKNYVYLKVENDCRFKPLSIVDERTDEYCIGPFRSKNKLLETIDMLENIYPIKKNGFSYEFQYRVLPSTLGKEEFEDNRKCLMEILFNDESMDLFLTENLNKMKEAASIFRYDLASTYRDLAQGLKYINLNNPNQKFEDRDILMGETIDGGYKIFFISNNLIVLKRKYLNLTNDTIESFLKQGKELSNNTKYNIDEKRVLDFKKIISAEIKDDNNKTVSFIDDKLSIDDFINKLKKKEG